VRLRSATTKMHNFRVERQRGGTKIRVRPGYVSGGGNRNALHAADITEMERVVYNPGT
jgi:hypothetical protein